MVERLGALEGHPGQPVVLAIGLLLLLEGRRLGPLPRPELVQRQLLLVLEGLALVVQGLKAPVLLDPGCELPTRRLADGEIGEERGLGGRLLRGERVRCGLLSSVEGGLLGTLPSDRSRPRGT
jgi:hypothetical protein